MAFASMFILFILFILAILAAIGLVGAIVTIVSLVRMRKRKKNGQKQRFAGLVIGLVIFFVPVSILSGLAVTGAIANVARDIRISRYDSFVEKWKNERTYERQAQEECLGPMFEAADAGDKERLISYFPETADKAELSRQLDSFLAEYPGGLAEGEFDFESPAMDGRYDDGKETKKFFGSGVVRKDGETYYVIIEAMFVNENEPENVGITKFTVESSIARAERMAARDNIDEDAMVYCRTSAEDPSAECRIIEGFPVIYNDTGKRSFDEMLKVLETERSMAGLKEKFGEPNATYYFPNSNGTDYYYELEEKAEDGEPLYFHIDTVNDKIIIDLCFTCSTRHDYKGQWLDDNGKLKVKDDKYIKLQRWSDISCSQQPRRRQL